MIVLDVVDYGSVSTEGRAAAGTAWWRPTAYARFDSWNRKHQKYVAEWTVAGTQARHGAF